MIKVGITHKLPFVVNVVFEDNSTRLAKVGDVLNLSVVAADGSVGNPGTFTAIDGNFAGFFLPGDVDAIGSIHVEGSAKDAAGADFSISGDSDTVQWAAENPPPVKPTGFAVVFADAVPL